MSLDTFLLSTNEFFEADCFEITLPNGSIIRATSHQNDLVVGGNTYFATTNGKWERGSVPQEMNTSSETEIYLQCDENILFPNSVSTPMFQRSKLFARSRVKITECYMDTNEVVQGTNIAFVGTITSPSVEASKVTFKCSDYSYLLQQAWPRRVIQSGCPFTVFDGNCALNRASFKVSKTVLAGSTQTELVVSSISALGNDSLPFSKGYIVPTSGEAQGWTIGIVLQLDATHIQLAPFDLPIAIGDTFDMYPGCNGTTDACGNKFSNLIHFGGMPYVPGPERAVQGG